jgi:hypothetical protein
MVFMMVITVRKKSSVMRQSTCLCGCGLLHLLVENTSLDIFIPTEIIGKDIRILVLLLIEEFRLVLIR